MRRTERASTGVHVALAAAACALLGWLSVPRALAAQAEEGAREKSVPLIVQVVDADGDGIPSLSCTLVPPSVLRKQLVPTGRGTDANGVVRFQAIPGFQYTLTFSPSLDAPYYGRHTLSVPKGKPEVRAKVTAEKCLDVRGRIVDSDGAPVKDMAIACYAKLADGGSRSWPTRTDQEGQFHIRLVRPLGPLFLSAGMRRGDEVLSVPETPLDRDRAEPLVLQARARGAEQQERVSVHGQFVRKDGGGATLVDVSGEILFIGPPDKRYDQPHTKRAVRVTAGKFTLRDALVGGYTVKQPHQLLEQGLYVTKPSFELTRESKSVELIVAGTPSTTVRLTDGQSGEPVVGASVNVAGIGKGLKTDRQGEVTFKVAAPRARIHVAHEAYPPISATVAAGRRVELQMRKGFTLAGKVVDGQGNPVKAATVLALSTADGQQATVTTETGEFAFARLRSNRIKLVVRGRGFRDWQFAPEVRVLDLTEDQEVEVSVKPGLSVSFSVKTDIAEVASQKVRSGEIALVHKPTGAPIAPIFGDGKALPGPIPLLPGTYQAFWLGDKVAFLVKTFEIAEPETVTIRIEQPGKRDILSRRQLLQSIFLPLPEE